MGRFIQQKWRLTGVPGARASIVKRNTATVLMVLGCGFWLFSERADRSAAADAVKWPDLFQKPYEHLETPDIGLKPVLQAADGTKITTREAWTRQRHALARQWLKHLGTPPARPDKLDIQVHSREAAADHVRVLLSFISEGNDRIRAYLLQPNDLKPGEKRPAVVVFHPTTKETLREPAGLGKRQEMALALHLVRRGYITLS